MPSRKDNHSRAKQAYDLRTQDRLEWDIIASRLGWRSASSPWNAAMDYAQNMGLPWPPDRARSMGEAAYHALARGICPDLIDKMMGGKPTKNRPREYARAWAKRKNLPWPPEKT